MTDAVCRSCAKPLAGRAGRTGRSSVYCSAACRQKAYRERQAAPVDTVRGLIEEVGRQVEALVPQPPSVFYSGVTDLASSVGRLRRIARVARDTAKDSVTRADVTKGPDSPVPADESTTAGRDAPHPTAPRTSPDQGPRTRASGPARFGPARFRHRRFRHTVRRHAAFRHAGLRDAAFRHAGLRDAAFRHAGLRDAGL
ncbi:hypothetical protein ABZ063_35845, partial [Streptomyces sp. NPDC006333]